MRSVSLRRFVLLAAALAIICLDCRSAGAANTLNWDTKADKVSASIESVDLIRLLEGISKLTGWQIYLESNTTHTASTTFKDLPPGEALRRLLGKLSFALVPAEDGKTRLYVFRTTREAATQLIRPGDLNRSGISSGKRIGNELIVTLKPGAKIEDIAKLVGAKVIGRIDGTDTYRLQFESDAAAEAARNTLATNPDVASVDYNYPVDRPVPGQPLNDIAAPDLTLKPKDPSGNCPLIIGLIDTGVRSLGKDLDTFLMPSIFVAGEPAATDELTHGPAMARTILQSLQASSGGKTSVKILPVDVYGNNQATTTFDVAVGIKKAVDGGANIINLSLGSSGDSTTLHSLIKSATQQGVIFFGAAGNQPVTTPVFPAAYPEVIAVTAGTTQGQVADYANRGSFVDVMAPGTSVVSYKGESYAVTGTSTATALVSGLAAGIADSSHNCPEQVVPTIRTKLGVNLGP